MIGADGDPARETRHSGFAALVGWTNVGKSTLLNRLVGTKLAAVAGVAQTTRRRIMGVRGVGDRGQVIFVDTPGVHEPRYKMNRGMVECARRAALDVDVAVLVVDASRGIGPGDLQVVAMLRRSTVRLMLLNKIDLLRKKSRLLPMIQQGVDVGFDTVIPVSGLTGEGCDAALDSILQRLPLGPPLFADDFLTDTPQRVLAAEWIREKLLELTRQELPHATAVLVERWVERDDGLLRIEATVLVDRDSQKKIVIGKRGELLKQIGSRAREELERLLERRVYLGLWVKVRRDWRDDESTLQELGLG